MSRATPQMTQFGEGQLSILYAWKSLIRYANTRWDTNTQVNRSIGVIQFKVKIWVDSILQQHFALRRSKTSQTYLHYCLDDRERFLIYLGFHITSSACSNSDRFPSEEVLLPLFSQENRAISKITSVTKLQRKNERERPQRIPSLVVNWDEIAP